MWIVLDCVQTHKVRHFQGIILRYGPNKCIALRHLLALKSHLKANWLTVHQISPRRNFQQETKSETESTTSWKWLLLHLFWLQLQSCVLHQRFKELKEVRCRAARPLKFCASYCVIKCSCLLHCISHLEYKMIIIPWSKQKNHLKDRLFTERIVQISQDRLVTFHHLLVIISFFMPKTQTLKNSL